jgi:hypothetical protein
MFPMQFLRCEEVSLLSWKISTSNRAGSCTRGHCNSITVLFSNAVAGESAIDRFACGIGGKHMLPHIIATVPQMLQNGGLIMV